MADIAYVCLSDMHFGADNSVLTNLGAADCRVDASRPSEVLIELVNCLRALIEHNEHKKPTLILNGDILEFALSTDNVAAEAFQRFLELSMPEDADKRLFDRKLIHIPGNHDHHLWETARETQYVDCYLARLAADKWPEPPWHATKMLNPDDVPARFLNGLIGRYPWLRDVAAVTVYPNYGLRSPDQKRLVIFSHGHFIEEIYRLMTTLADLIFRGRSRGNAAWDIEAENFAWIDFFWSTMGRSGGGVGPDVESVYDSMQSADRFSELVSRFAGALVGRYGKGVYQTRIVKRLVTFLLGVILKNVFAGRLERGERDQLLSNKGEGLRSYVEGPLFEQLKAELKLPATAELGYDVPPGELTFIFGHTHKPFEEVMGFGPQARPITVYNSGGWVVDRPKAQRLYGGAVILLDEDLDAVTLRLYNEAETAQEYAVRAAAVGPPQSPAQVLRGRIERLIDPGCGPWKNFSDAAARAVALHTQKLARELSKPLA